MFKSDKFDVQKNRRITKSAWLSSFQNFALFDWSMVLAQAGSSMKDKVEEHEKCFTKANKDKPKETLLSDAKMLIERLDDSGVYKKETECYSEKGK